MLDSDRQYVIRDGVEELRNAIIAARRDQKQGTLDVEAMLVAFEAQVGAIRDALAASDDALQTHCHALRNRLAVVQNAASYVKRRTQTTAIWESDKRVPGFFGAIDDELTKAEEIIGHLTGENERIG